MTDCEGAIYSSFEDCEMGNPVGCCCCDDGEWTGGIPTVCCNINYECLDSAVDSWHDCMGTCVDCDMCLGACCDSLETMMCFDGETENSCNARGGMFTFLGPGTTCMMDCPI